MEHHPPISWVLVFSCKWPKINTEMKSQKHVGSILFIPYSDSERNYKLCSVKWNLLEKSCLVHHPPPNPLWVACVEWISHHLMWLSFSIFGVLIELRILKNQYALSPPYIHSLLSLNCPCSSHSSSVLLLLSSLFFLPSPPLLPPPSSLLPSSCSDSVIIRGHKREREIELIIGIICRCLSSL